MNKTTAELGPWQNMFGHVSIFIDDLVLWPENRRKRLRVCARERGFETVAISQVIPGQLS